LRGDFVQATDDLRQRAPVQRALQTRSQIAAVHLDKAFCRAMACSA
jgi:hypothetical protein